MEKTDDYINKVYKNGSSQYERASLVENYI